MRIPLFALGLFTVAVASGLYIGARLGPGPRDGLMTGLHRRTGLRIWIVRTGIEVVVLAIGWILGGNVGIGTLLFALLIGPMVGFTIPLLTVEAPSVRPPVIDEGERMMIVLLILLIGLAAAAIAAAVCAGQDRRLRPPGHPRRRRTPPERGAAVTRSSKTRGSRLPGSHLGCSW